MDEKKIFLDSEFRKLKFTNKAIISYNFKSCIFENLNFENCDFINCNFENCKLILCDLTKSEFSDSSFDNCDFLQNRLKELQILNCVFQKTQFEGNNINFETIGSKNLISWESNKRIPYDDLKTFLQNMGSLSDEGFYY